MGLDINHYKSVLQKPKGLNPFNHKYISEDNYEGFDVNFGYFNNYVQIIDIPKTLKTLIFAKKESEIDEIKNFLKYDYDFFYEPNILNIDNVVDKFIKQNHIEGSLLHKWEAPKWIGFNVFEWERKSGFYYEEAGYQRKGMNERFGERFNSDSNYRYTQKADFEFALSCVDFYWDDDTQEGVEQRKWQFKADFIDKYENNRSWMHISF
ncbi:MAG TPA: hypothetical protein VF941_16575 [Clostridia bacterium]